MFNRKAISTAKIAVLIVVLIVVIGAGVYFETSSTAPTTVSSTTAATTTSALRDTISIDATLWPINDLNPIPDILYLTGSEWVGISVYQSLVTLNGSLLYQTGNTSEVLPMLATDWTVSPDGMTYTFNLRQNVTFSNGDPFNAYQAWGDWYNFYYLTGNASNFMNGYDVFDTSNVNFGPATIALMTQSGVINPSPSLLSIMTNNTWPIYVTVPYQIVLHLKVPFRYFLQLLPTYMGMMLDTQYILQNGGFGTPVALNTYFNTHPIPGTGPYVVSDFQIGSYEKVTQNPTYWGRNLTPQDIQANPYLDPGHVKNIIIYAKPDDVVRYTDLSTGAVQIASILTQDWPIVQTNPDKYGYFVFPSNSLIFAGIGMNVLRFPTNITAFRKAIVYAINVTDVNQKVYYGMLVPMVGPEYRGAQDFYDLGNLPPYPYNLTLAKQYLAESGVNIAMLPPLEFRVIAGCTNCVATAQVVQADLSAIGINVNIIVTPPSEYALPYSPGVSSYSASVADAQQESQLNFVGFPDFAPGVPTPADAWIDFVSLNSPTGNYANYGNAVVQKCVDIWFSTTDVTAIKEACTAANAQIYNDVPYIWLGTPTLPLSAGSVVWDKSVVQGFIMDPTFTGQQSVPILNTITFVS
jgi:peptide/nickel transport system substrate-binding protein